VIAHKLDICPMVLLQISLYSYPQSSLRYGWDSRGEAVSTLSPLQEIAKDGEGTILTEESLWYALQTRSRHEKQVRDRLAAVGVESLLPLSRQYRLWSDRKVLTTVPLFGGYCFANFSLAKSRNVLQIPGVARIVGATKPEPIPGEEIAAFQQLSLADRMVEPCDYLIEGAWVEVVQGPLAGLRGQFVRRNKHHGLVIRATLIQQAALVHIEADEVALIQ
jgi:transcription termination/antitermination protein NusG